MEEQRIRGTEKMTMKDLNDIEHERNAKEKEKRINN